MKPDLSPQSQKLANVQPVSKKDSRADPSYYRPISVTFYYLFKYMERVINSKLLGTVPHHPDTEQICADHINFCPEPVLFASQLLDRHVADGRGSLMSFITKKIKKR